MVDPVYLCHLPLRLRLLLQLLKGFGGENESQLVGIIVVADRDFGLNLIFSLLKLERDRRILERGNFSISACKRRRSMIIKVIYNTYIFLAWCWLSFVRM